RPDATRPIGLEWNIVSRTALMADAERALSPRVSKDGRLNCPPDWSSAASKPRPPLLGRTVTLVESSTVPYAPTSQALPGLFGRMRCFVSTTITDVSVDRSRSDGFATGVPV